ncbi:hypothetical protein BDY24DRAFT_411879 [Mrakia frigida]|uniref:uncharacterized protein n=1 Tax=Mrakia frigida TaxID=29902 RepID=UPI003FCC1BCD
MVHAHTLTSTFFHLASLVLLVLTTFSAPFISSIFFLERAPGSTRYGAFGTCQGPGGCSKATLGWEGGDEFRMWMVRSLILWGIAAAFSLIAFLLILPAWVHRFVHPSAHHFAAALTLLTSMLAFAFSAALFIQARNNFREEGSDDAQLGPALWIGLGGFVATLMMCCVGPPREDGSFYRYRKGGGGGVRY